MRSRQKVISLILVFVFLSLNFALELTHHHGNPSAVPEWTQAGQPSDGHVAPETHKLGCTACFFSITHVAPTATCFIFNPESDSYTAFLRESALYTVTLPTAYHLRAPPQTI